MGENHDKHDDNKASREGREARTPANLTQKPTEEQGRLNSATNGGSAGQRCNERGGEWPRALKIVSNVYGNILYWDSRRPSLPKSTFTLPTSLLELVSIIIFRQSNRGRAP
jgi:hypothetical protein